MQTRSKRKCSGSAPIQNINTCRYSPLSEIQKYLEICLPIRDVKQIVLDYCDNQQFYSLRHNQPAKRLVMPDVHTDERTPHWQTEGRRAPTTNPNSAVLTYKQYIYCVSLTTFTCFDPTTKNWTPLPPPMLHYVNQPILIGIKDHLFILSQVTCPMDWIRPDWHVKKCWQSSNQVYSFRTKTWHNIHYALEDQKQAAAYRGTTITSVLAYQDKILIIPLHQPWLILDIKGFEQRKFILEIRICPMLPIERYLSVGALKYATLFNPGRLHAICKHSVPQISNEEEVQDVIRLADFLTAMEDDLAYKRSEPRHVFKFYVFQDALPEYKPHNNPTPESTASEVTMEEKLHWQELAPLIVSTESIIELMAEWNGSIVCLVAKEGVWGHTLSNVGDLWFYNDIQDRWTLLSQNIPLPSYNYVTICQGILPERRKPHQPLLQVQTRKKRKESCQHQEPPPPLLQPSRFKPIFAQLF